MAAIEVRRLSIPGGAILCDAQLATQLSPDWFDAGYWRQRCSLSATEGGRGGACFVATPCGDMVLRRYLRGGMVAKLNREHYLYFGEARTRSFAEFEVLAELADAGLAVPRPRAAAYWRRGVTYRAAILVERIAAAHPLPVRFQALGPSQFAAVGTAVATLHRHGVWHADLNAHNILLDDAGKVWLIDFDRARRRAAAESTLWMQGNLARLRRSLLKLGAPQRVRDFAGCWRTLIESHQRALGAVPAEPAQ